MPMAAAYRIPMKVTWTIQADLSLDILCHLCRTMQRNTDQTAGCSGDAARQGSVGLFHFAITPCG
jgi:hypothetical protein